METESRRAAAAAGISTREAEVLTLVGEHLSNAEIGARLFISVRTVESHMSSLLRKLGVPDRRAVARLAAEMARAKRPPETLVELPSPLTSFIGRQRERAALAEAVKAHREVTAVGPGGVGKTRLALRVAADVSGDFADEAWFVNLVPITDPAMVGAAVAAAVGIGEQQGRDMDESVLAALADRRALLVLDNCEHVRDGVAPFVERLLAGCPRLTVLATSRARLMVPFEHVYLVPPLSMTDGAAAARAGADRADAAGEPREPVEAVEAGEPVEPGEAIEAGEPAESDAVALFLERAAAVGRPVPPDHRDQAAEVCRRLDGVALAIELAAARLPALGFDGLAAALSDQLRLLAGGSRADDRHRSVRAMLDWSHALLEAADMALLRRVSVFVAPFTVDAAAQVAGFPPLTPDMVVDGLARLAEQSLLLVAPDVNGTTYRAPETIRQYGLERLAEAGDIDVTRSRHLRWCLAYTTDLRPGSAAAAGSWRARFDTAADDIRAALGWAAGQPEHRSEAYELALSLAGLAFIRNFAGESQQRYEQAAVLAADPAATAAALRSAAAVAGCRELRDDMYRLHRASADAARRAGDSAGAARDLAMAATAVYRFAGVFARLPSRDEATALLAAARELAGDDPAAQAAVARAQCGALADRFISEFSPEFSSEQAGLAPELTAMATRAVELARRTGDPLTECTALDALTRAQYLTGDTPAAAATARHRIHLLSSVPATPARTYELVDALVMAANTSIGAGDISGARRWGRQLRDLPSLAEVGHFATSWLLLAEALAGNVADVLTGSRRFLDGWTRSGRVQAPRLALAAAAVAMIHGLRGDDDARGEWLEIVDELGVTPELRAAGYGRIFDAIVLLHRGQAKQALEQLAAEPDELRMWVARVWRPWYAALRAEAAALAGHPDARRLIVAVRSMVVGNPVADAMVDRVEALLDDDRDRLLGAAAVFDAAGCRYQWARTLRLAGGDDAATGAAALTDLGLAPMSAKTEA